MATSSISYLPSGLENYQLFSYASESEVNRKITAIIENYLAPTLEMERDGRSAIQFMPDVIRLHQLTSGTYSLATRYPNPIFTYLKLLREEAIRLFSQHFMMAPTPEGLRDKADFEWPCRDEVLAKCGVAYGRLLITLMTERFAMHSKINIHKFSSLFLAVIRQDAELVKYMIEQRCSLKLYPPLGDAVMASNRNIEIVQLLVDAKADTETTDASGDTPLIWAAFLGDEQAVRILLTAGADIEHIDNSGASPLSKAACVTYPSKIKDYKAIVQSLIKAGAIINQADQYGRTPLMRALNTGAVEVAECLIPGSDVNMRDSSDETALMQAATSCPNLVNALIMKGARVNLQNNKGRIHPDPVLRELEEFSKYKGWTALFYATSSGQEEAVKSLLAAKADPGIVDSKGKRAIDYANGNARIIAMLNAPRSI